MSVVAVLAVLACPAAWSQTERAPAAGALTARLGEAQANARLGETLLKNGRKVSTVCANCHGDGGNSVRPDVPNLAGQNSAYLLEQMRQFGDGTRRNEFMQGMIKAMNTDEKVGLALFYASQTVVSRPPGNPALAAQGEALFQRICFRCHGNDGRGNDKIARIAGQQSAYLLTTLRRYRSGSGERVNDQMAENTRLLTEANVEALVAYVASMK